MLLAVGWCALAVAGLGLGGALALALLLGGPTPLDVTGLARDAIRWSVPARHDWRVGRVALRWPVFRAGPAAPLVIVIDDASLPGEAGLAELRIGEAVIGLHTAALLAGRIRPVTLHGHDIALALAPPPPPPPGASRGTPPGAPPGAPPPPPGARFGGPAVADRARAIVASLRDVDVRRLAIATGRPELGVLTLDRARFARTRPDAIAGAATLTVAPPGGAVLPISLRAVPVPGGTLLALDTGRAVSANRLATLVPALTLVRAPVALDATATLDGAGTPGPLRVRATLGPGALLAAGGAVPIADASAVLDATPGPAGWPGGRIAVALRSLQVRLGDPGAPDAPILTADGAITGDWRPDGALAGRIAVALDHVPAAALPRYWPPGLGRGARSWITTNIPTGTVSGGKLALALRSRDGAAGLAVSGVAGGLDATGLDVHWLRPIAPFTAAAGHVAVLDADRVAITLASGTENGLDLAGSRMLVTGLDAPVQTGRIAVRVRGTLPAMLAVLSAPRLGLLRRAPFTVTDPAGAGTVALDITLPLDARVKLADIAVSADASLAGVHLGALAAGLSLDDARLALHADTDGLAVSGDGTVAALPVRLRYALDFRAGPPDGVTEHAHVTSDADAAALARAGLPLGHRLGGELALAVDYAVRRDHTATVALDADLARASVATPFGWSKPTGPAARLAAVLRLDRGRLVAIERLRATGPGLALAAHGELGPGGAVRAIAVERLVLGRTVASGRVVLPGPADRRVAVALRGPSLDLAPLLGRSASSGGPVGPGGAVGTAAGGAPWAVALGFDRVWLPGGGSLAGVTAHATGRGAVPTTGLIRVAGPGAATLQLLPAGGGNSTVRLRSADAGALLAASGLSGGIAGGRLVLDGTTAGPVTGAPFTGHLRIDDFALRRAPWAARLLRDLTVYGLVDASRGPGLGITRLDASIGFRDGVLTVSDGRVFQAALGLTAAGTVDLDRARVDLHGTVVPAYAVNSLPGRLPLLGRLFSPEKGGGLFAATWRVQGPVAKPTVSVNPLAALVPGVLRRLLPP